MVYMVSQLESAALLDVSYYRETTAFVRYLKEVKGLKVAVTGHSLGTLRAFLMYLSVQCGHQF